jgi:formyltetrahydrofolate deformylase
MVLVLLAVFFCSNTGEIEVYVFKLSCDDRPGIVAAVSRSLRDNGCNIEESSQFNDQLSGRFFMRVVFDLVDGGSAEGFLSDFDEMSGEFNGKVPLVRELYDMDEKVKTLILVSKYDHCLHDLLYRRRKGHFPVEITAVVSNHEEARELVEWHGIDFHYLPIVDGDKRAQEEKVSELVEKTGSELIVLARYMQVLSSEMCEKYEGRVINIHHSFLPGFKGARPYNQAYERGVKIIGATAHFVNSDLDEGPIIEQEVVRVDHSFTPQKLQLAGMDIEDRVLSRAVKCYAERRVFLYQGRTVIL